MFTSTILDRCFTRTGSIFNYREYSVSSDIHPVISNAGTAVPGERVESEGTGVTGSVPPPGPSVVVNIGYTVVRLTGDERVARGPITQPHECIKGDSKVAVRKVNPVRGTGSVIGTVAGVDIDDRLPVGCRPRVRDTGTRVVPIPVSVEHLQPGISVECVPAAITADSAPPALTTTEG